MYCCLFGCCRFVIVSTCWAALTARLLHQVSPSRITNQHTDFQDKAPTHHSQLCTFGSSAMLWLHKLNILRKCREQHSSRKPASCCTRKAVRLGHHTQAAEAAPQNMCVCIASRLTQVVCQLLAGNSRCCTTAARLYHAGCRGPASEVVLAAPRRLPLPKPLPAAGRPGSGASLLSPWSGCRTPAASNGARTLSPMRCPGLCRLTARPSHAPQSALQLLQGASDRTPCSLTW